MLWVGVGGHRSLLMGMVWVRVQIKRKMLGSAGEEAGRKRLNLLLSTRQKNLPGGRQLPPMLWR